MKKILILSILLLGLTGCTDNGRVKNWGGTATLNLPKGQKLLNVTWKESQLWYLSRPMNNTDSAQTYYFQEESSWGMMEGTYIIKEEK